MSKFNLVSLRGWQGLVFRSASSGSVDDHSTYQQAANNKDQVQAQIQARTGC